MSITVDEARKKVYANLSTGIKCPCCDQLARQYRRKISGPAVRCLIRLYWKDQGEYHYFKDFFGSGMRPDSGDFAKLRYWGLITEKPNDDETKKNSGFWKITDFGRYFVENKVTIKSHCFVYDGNSFGLDGDNISIVEALGNKFNYQELMRG